MHLPHQEGVLLAVEGAHVDLTLAFKHHQQVLVVNEGDLAGRWTHQLEDLLPSDLVVYLQRASEKDRDFPASRKRTKQHLFDLVVRPPKDDLVEDAQLAQTLHANLLRVDV